MAKIKNSDTFETALNEATRIRTYIQEKLRKEYNAFSKAFSVITGKEARFVKFFTDIIYYKKGGYPTEATLPKHEQYTIDFVEMVKFLEFLGLREIMLEPTLKKYGITISIDPAHKIQNLNLDVDSTIKAQLIVRKALQDPKFKIQARTTMTLIRELLLHTVPLQGKICKASDVIKHSLTDLVKKSCDITKEDFKDSIQFSIDLKKNKLSKSKIAAKDSNMKSKIQIYQDQQEKIELKKKKS